MSISLSISTANSPAEPITTGETSTAVNAAAVIARDTITLTIAGIFLRDSSGLKAKMPRILANTSRFVSRFVRSTLQKSISHSSKLRR